MRGVSSAACPCSNTAEHAASNALSPWVMRAPSMPASTSPVPPVASRALPVGLMNEVSTMLDGLTRTKAKISQYGKYVEEKVLLAASVD